MSNHLLVGNLATHLTEADLLSAFAQHAEVISASLLLDSESGVPLGCGFVELATTEGAAAALAALNGIELGGQAVSVSEVEISEGEASV